MQKRRYRKLEDSGVYIDSYELAKVIYHAIFEFPKKDRVVMGDRLMSLAFAMVSDVAMAYRFMERRVEYIDSFIGRYDQGVRQDKRAEEGARGSREAALGA